MWYPENKLSFRITSDPDTGKYFRVEKVYDEDGNYSHQVKELKFALKKKPGTNFYKADYQ